jgi:hypothetical protein
MLSYVYRSNAIFKTRSHLADVFGSPKLTFCIPHFCVQLTPWSRVLLEKLRVRSASQEIPRILWNPKVHHRVHKSPPRIPIVSQMNPVHIPKPCFPKMHLNVVLPSTPRSSQWSPSFRPPNQNVVYTPHLPHARLCLQVVFSLVSPSVSVTNRFCINLNRINCTLRVDRPHLQAAFSNTGNKFCYMLPFWETKI